METNQPQPAPRRTLRMWVRVLATAALASVLWSTAIAPSEATYIGAASLTSTVGTDTFSPPTNLKATRSCSLIPWLYSSSVTISWIAATETYATGYRLTTNAGASQIVSGRTTTSLRINISQSTSYTFTLMAISANKWTSVQIGPTGAVSC